MRAALGDYLEIRQRIGGGHSRLFKEGVMPQVVSLWLVALPNVTPCPMTKFFPAIGRPTTEADLECHSFCICLAIQDA